CIGELLEEKARQGVKVRVLCWSFLNLSAINLTGLLGETSTPGRSAGGIADRPKTHTDDQYEYDKWWYARYDHAKQNITPGVADSSPIADHILSPEKRIPRLRQIGNPTEQELRKIKQNLEFLTRGFTSTDRSGIKKRAYTDKDISSEHLLAMSGAPSHHQKVVLIDVELPDDHVAFVMGHNTLDLYWDTPGHSYYHFSKEPKKGRNVAPPRQDVSSRVTGPIVRRIYSNFKAAWEKEGGKGLTDLPWEYFKKFPLYTSKLVACEGGNATPETVKAALDGITTGGAQILRTQIQNDPPRFGIRRSYEHVIKRASNYIYIENQYFRWPPLVEWIKEAARQKKALRPNEPLYLFVVTNSSDEGVGSGTLKTWEMLDSLGRADVIPGIAREKRIRDLSTQLNQIEQEIRKLKGLHAPSTSDAEYVHYIANAKKREEIAGLEEQERQLRKQLTKIRNDTEGKTILPEEHPGLKVHICTLTAPDTPAGKPWPEVYVHSKLMMIDDIFMTLGSANINTRSMETDSEMNIAHAQGKITQKTRRELWIQHTRGRGAQDDMKRAFEEWGRIIDENRNNERDLLPPVASLRGFRRINPKISNLD
ncbi:MAG: phospholipase D-like domain-containing protein, partial [Azoarcus sp.]|nr:phospholipase D-like domain-containing protein [Azoarcus sp.]